MRHPRLAVSDSKKLLLYLSQKAARTDSVDDSVLFNLPAFEGNAEEQILKRDEAMRGRKILRSIPDPYREVFMWRVFAQLSYKQIGELFGKTENWACVTYHRARGMIRTGLEENENEK